MFGFGLRDESVSTTIRFCATHVLVIESLFRSLILLETPGNINVVYFCHILINSHNRLKC